MADSDGEVTRGVTVYDESSGQYGTVADATLSPGWIHVRPLGGGIEWKARREHLRPATTGELLAERMRNERSTAGDWS